MINNKILEEINFQIAKKNHLEEILRDFKSNYVETTIGLVEVNSASDHKVNKSEKSTWLHQNYPKIEHELKAYAEVMLKVEISKIDHWLNERNVS